MKRDAFWESGWRPEEALSRHENCTLYYMLRGLSDKLNSTNDNTKKADGTFVRSKHLHCWKEHGLYNHDPGPTTVPPEIDPHHFPLSDTEPTIEEVKHMNGKTQKVKATAVSARTTVKLASVPPLVRSQWKSSGCACKNIVSSKAKKSKPVFDLGGIAAIRFSFFANWSTKEFNVDRGQGLCSSTANRRWS